MDSVMVDMVHAQAIDGRAPPGGRSPPAVTEPPLRGEDVFPPPRSPSGAGDLAAVEQRLETVPFHDGDAVLLRLLELGRPRLGAEDDSPGPGRHAPRRLAPPGQD